MIFGKYPISTACQKRDGNSDRKEDKNRDTVELVMYGVIQEEIETWDTKKNEEDMKRD